MCSRPFYFAYRWQSGSQQDHYGENHRDPAVLTDGK
jgi:hypothetical protein